MNNVKQRQDVTTVMSGHQSPSIGIEEHPLRREIYKMIAQRFQINSALYPGCGYDIVPSRYIQEVVYLDNFKAVADFFSNREKLLNDLSDKKTYSGPCRMSFYEMDYHSPINLPQFDLLISQYAGDVGQAMKRFLRPGGILLAAEGPEDADLALKDPEYELLGTITGADGKIELEPGLAPAAFLKLDFDAFAPSGILGQYGVPSIPIDRNFCFRKRFSPGI